MEKTYLQEVGERLLKCRNYAFISRKELAKYAGVTVQTVAKMERGEEAVSIEQAVKICTAFGYSLDYILTGKCGLSELVKMNQSILNLPHIHSDNMRKVAEAFWSTCPRYIR